VQLYLYHSCHAEGHLHHISVVYFDILHPLIPPVTFSIICYTEPYVKLSEINISDQRFSKFFAGVSLNEVENFQYSTNNIVLYINKKSAFQKCCPPWE
jgi:hypothetical protein